MKVSKARISVEFDSEYISSHSGDALVDRFMAEFASQLPTSPETESKTENSCVLVIDCSDMDRSDLYLTAREVMEDKLGVKMGNGVASIKVRAIYDDGNDARQEEQTRKAAKPSKQDEIDDEEEETREEEEPSEEVGSDTAKVSAHIEPNGKTLEQINALLGAEQFKAYAAELAEVAPNLVETGSSDSFVFKSYLFSIGDGCGLSTALELFAKHIDELGLFSFTGKDHVKEIEIADGPEGYSKALSKAEGYGMEKQIVCFDISRRMGEIDSDQFREFLKSLEKKQGSEIFVFRVPFLDEYTIRKNARLIGDILSVRVLSFPPFSVEDYHVFAEKEFVKYGLTLSEPAWQVFDSKLNDERSDGRFYGFRTVRKVVKELTYEKQLANARGAVKSEIVSIRDVMALANDDDEKTGMEMLDEMVGMELVKERIKEIVAALELERYSDPTRRACMHMRFTGNPGTGKTTVARIVGKILKEKGLLRTGNLFEYTGRDLCGRYVGETAPKTAAICRDAYGSVLFIDEAYSLYRNDHDSADYGREALDTLVAEMENHRSDFVVIMAGYTDDMDKLMRGNVGLESRMPHLLEFPNMSRDELSRVFMTFARKGCGTDDTLEAAVREYFDSIPDDKLKEKEFSNARFVRNLYERTWTKAALRGQLAGMSGVVLTATDFEEAARSREFASLNEKKRPVIGF